MDHATRLAMVRNLVAAHFARLTGGEAGDCLETILIRDGYYHGRRFSCEAGCAEWLLDEPVVRFYDPAGRAGASLRLDTDRNAKQDAA